MNVLPRRVAASAELLIEIAEAAVVPEKVSPVIVNFTAAFAVTIGVVVVVGVSVDPLGSACSVNACVLVIERLTEQVPAGAVTTSPSTALLMLVCSDTGHAAAPALDGAISTAAASNAPTPGLLVIDDPLR